MPKILDKYKYLILAGLTTFSVGILVLIGLVFLQFFPNFYQLTESQARKIAEKECLKGGESISLGYYNDVTKTWWFDANLNATQEGCYPACVVSEETRKAEINWRCTGLVEPPVSSCGIENCHGMDIVCGYNPVQMCTMEYRIGDKCRQYARCEEINGSCQKVENPLFDECKSCVENCIADNKDDGIKQFECEASCGSN